LPKEKLSKYIFQKFRRTVFRGGNRKASSGLRRVGAKDAKSAILTISFCSTL
jgi:hypothetical protein